MTGTSTQTVVTESGGDGTSRLIRLVIGLLTVVGLLIMVMTWRYWVWTNPKRGYTYSRAKLVVPAGDRRAMAMDEDQTAVLDEPDEHFERDELDSTDPGTPTPQRTG